MKKISLILVFLGVVFTAQAQNDFLEKKPISVGYFGHQGQQVGNADLETELAEKRRNLATVISLMIEKVLHQQTKLPLAGNAFHVAVRECGLVVRLTGFGHKRLDYIVHLFTR